MDENSGRGKQSLKLGKFGNTVKPVLTATSEKRPPVNNDRTKSGQAHFDTNFD
jgi:hypothetical protein